MALTDENGGGMVMPVTPMNNAGNGGFGFGDNGAFWILLLFILLGGNCWGNGFGGGFGGGNDLYPWMNQSNQINGGFRDQMLSTQINGIQSGITSGFGDVQNSLCAGFAGVNASIVGAQNGITQQMYANQIADLERSFAAQTANTQGMNALQSQLAQCCCDNRAATADLKYTVATENCADRTQAMQNTRDIIDSQTRSTQAILDKLCALELDGVKSQLAAAQRENTGLQNQLNMAAFRESQANQNALFAQGMNNEVDALYNRLKNCPVGTTPVYGNQPIFTCPQAVNSCGCGNNGF
jgi:hypothetical protein